MAEPNDWDAVTVEGMDAPVAGLCFKSGCHYAALLQARAEIANLQAEITRLKAETK